MREEILGWYFSTETDNEEGPVSVETLQTLYASGSIKDETLVRAEGMNSWKPYAVIFPSKHINNIPTVNQSKDNYPKGINIILHILTVLTVAVLGSFICILMSVFLNIHTFMPIWFYLIGAGIGWTAGWVLGL